MESPLATTVWWLVFALAIGSVGHLLWAWGQNWPELTVEFWRMTGINVLVSGAAAVLGGMLGFIFGIPRTALPSDELATGTTVARMSTAARLVVNTNLERVSDWLTTLLIGATLTQLVNIPTALWGMAGRLANFTQAAPPPTLLTGQYRTVLVALMLYFFLTGFLGLYLITRLYLTQAFQDALVQVGVVPPTAGKPTLEQVLQRAREALDQSDHVRALNTLDEVKDDARAWQNRQLQALRARALGRRWIVEQALKTEQTKLDATKAEALGALKAAAEGEPEIQAELKKHLEPDGDLAAFKDDPELKKALGIS